MFENPSMIWWAAAASVPIAIHLLSRRRFVRVPWAAMDFLNRAFKKTRKRLRLENLILLILRALALILLALALAEPQFSSGGLLGAAGERRQLVFFVVDDSFSTDHKDAAGEVSPFLKARRRARALAEELDPQRDAASLVIVGAPAHLVVPPTQEIGRIRSELDKLAVSHGGTDLTGAIKIVGGQLADAETMRDFPGERTILILTDLQKKAFTTPASPDAAPADSASDIVDPALENALREIRDAGARVVVVDVGQKDEKRPANVAVTSLVHSGKTLVRGQKTVFEARIRNFGDQTASGEVQFFVDNEQAFVQTERLAALKGAATGTRAECEIAVTFAHEFAEAGPHHVAVRWIDDALKIDNVRRFSFKVRDAIRTLTVDGGTEREADRSSTFYAGRALDPALGHSAGGAFSVRDLSVVDFAQEEIGTTDLIVLADVSSLPAQKVQALEAFVRQGGALLFFVGRNFEGDALQAANNLWWKNGQGLLPARLLRTVGNEEAAGEAYGMSFGKDVHEALAYFKDERIQPAVARIPVQKFVEIEAPASEDAARVMTTFLAAKAGADARNYPAIVERRFGRGTVVFFATTADTDWNLFGATPAYVPLLREIAFYATRAPSNSNFQVGTSHAERFDAVVQKVLVSEGGEPEVEKALSLLADKSAAELAFPKFDKAELITLRPVPAPGADPAKAEKPRRLAVNVDSEESDLERVDAAWLASHFGADLVRVVGENDAVEAREARRTAGGFRKQLLLALVLAMVLESILARRFAPKEGTEAAA